jgi:hypothetical protein
LEIFLEEKGLLEASSELGEESLGLDGVWHKVGVVAIGLFFLLIFGSIRTISWRGVILDGEDALTVRGDHCALSEKVSTVSLLPLEANEPHDVWCVLGKLAEEGTICITCQM